MRQVAHPSMFIKKEVYDRLGLYDTDLKIAMDYELLVRIRNEKFIFLETILICFAPGGISDKQFIFGLLEVKKSYQKHIGKNIKQNFWQFRQKLLHHFMQTRLGKSWFKMKNKDRIIS
jgi:hypothetical protein